MAGSSGPDIITDGLIFAFDGGDTNSYDITTPVQPTIWKDLSGNGNNGSLIQGIEYNGSGGGSLVFNGTSNYVSIPSAFIGPQSSFTYEIAVYRTGNGTDWPRFFLNGAVNSSITITQYNDTTGVLFRFTNSKGNFEEYNLPEGTLVNNQWVLLSFSGYASGGYQLRAYINGVQYGNGVGINSPVAPQSQITTIGGDATSSWEGRIGYSRLYNRALSSTEIKQNFDAMRSRFGV